MSPALFIGPTLRLKAQGSAEYYIVHHHISSMLLILLDQFFQNSPINWAVLNGNENMEYMRKRPTKMTK
jgi:hypothetical protein